ncbi:MAG: undecaprenyl/decaprenyl-phosphate alpha-N-acetylglucosaminyl 1-phosphate transferase [Ruminococcaceae bacterium]|nr:undecaprenyl/decaprenyl-phosphate alpha-N-acetylglucosaminyl 1-phosphate transferase [Oscillospiraceae bacterium]
MLFIVLAMVVAFLISFATTPVVIGIAKKIKAIDVPKDERRVHKKPIPLIGGLAIFYGFLISVLCFCDLEEPVIGILTGALIIVITGVIDDKYSLPAKVKLLMQIVAAVVVLVFGIEIKYIENPFTNQYITFGWLSIPITIIWIVGVTNAVNLTDGLDGLAAGISTIASLSLLILIMFTDNVNLAIITAALAGAGFGFLPYNFNPAKIFMGDTGSMFLGYMLACISVQGLMKTYTVISFAMPILVLGLPIFDTIFAIVRRLVTGRSIMSPDRGHLHHRLLDMGFSQRQTVAILYTLTAILCLTALVMFLRNAFSGLILVIAVVLIIIISFAVLDAKSEQEKTNQQNKQ